MQVYKDFSEKVDQHKAELVSLLTRLKNEGKTVMGYGASTKGNVVLQYCNITTDILCNIAEVNEDKFGSFTPGTLIPIISETDAKTRKPDYLMVLPWHFRESFLVREKSYMEQGGKLIFPLPEIEIL